MKITLGDRKRYHVYDMRVNGRSALRQMWQGKQIWPDGEQGISRIVLDTEGTLGTKDYAVWKTVRAVYANNAVSEKFNMSADIDARDYAIDKAFHGEGHVAYYTQVANGEDILDFGRDGPGAGTVKAGDYIYLRVKMDGWEPAEGEKYCYVIPESTDSSKEFNVDLPGWDGLKFHIMHYKPKKKIKSGLQASLVRKIDGKPDFEWSTTIGGDKRGQWWFTLETKYTSRNTGYTLKMSTWRYAYGRAHVQTAAINTTVRVKVKRVIHYGE